MIYDEKKAEDEGVLQVANLICIAARTAPKAKGIDNIKTAIVLGDTKDKIVCEMEKIGNATGDKHFFRDAESLKKSKAVVLIGTKLSPLGLNCGMCRENCEMAKEGKVVCGFNLVDLGIAIGSAVSVAADLRVDNRIMYRIGVAASSLKIFEDDVKIIFGIPLSVSGKNIFFDR